jgi:hypothetical protein
MTNGHERGSDTMFALRQVQPINGNFLTIQLPIEFEHYSQAEIIVLPIDSSKDFDNATNVCSPWDAMRQALPILAEFDLDIKSLPVQERELF